MSLLWLLLACAPSPETLEVSRARQFADVLRAGQLTRCAELEGPEWRGHCENALGAPCEEITAGPWQQECYFARAESPEPRAEAERLADCGRSGSFAQECLTHLFKVALGPTLAAAPAKPDVVSMTAEAEALASRWAKEVTPWSPPWGWWWRNLHQASTPLDRGVCDLAPQAQRRACQREAVSALGKAWRSEDEAVGALCGLSLEQAREAVKDNPTLAWAPNPDLDELVAKAIQRACAPN